MLAKMSSADLVQANGLGFGVVNVDATARDGRVTDAKTLIGMLWLKALRRVGSGVAAGKLRSDWR